MKTPIESYVVRIYRCHGGTRRQVVGMVESPRFAISQAFRNVDELWEILVASTRIQKTNLRAKSSNPGD